MTENPASVVDADAFTVSRTVHIQAPVEKVWSAVTKPEHISQWFGRIELDGSGPGARGTIFFEGYDPTPVIVEHVDAPRSVSYRWGQEDTSTVFTFTLASLADGTQLTVEESGFERTAAPAEEMADHAGGWVSELDKLVAFAERSE